MVLMKTKAAGKQLRLDFRVPPAALQL